MEKEILKEAFNFHGHICWASAAGVRAGLAALRQLGVGRTGTSGELHCNPGNRREPRCAVFCRRCSIRHRMYNWKR